MFPGFFDALKLFVEIEVLETGDGFGVFQGGDGDFDGHGAGGAGGHVALKFKLGAARGGDALAGNVQRTHGRRLGASGHIDQALAQFKFERASAEFDGERGGGGGVFGVGVEPGNLDQNHRLGMRGAGERGIIGAERGQEHFLGVTDAIGFPGGLENWELVVFQPAAVRRLGGEPELADDARRFPGGGQVRAERAGGKQNAAMRVNENGVVRWGGSCAAGARDPDQYLEKECVAHHAMRRASHKGRACQSGGI